MGFPRGMVKANGERIDGWKPNCKNVTDRSIFKRENKTAR